MEICKYVITDHYNGSIGYIEDGSAVYIAMDKSNNDERIFFEGGCTSIDYDNSYDKILKVVKV